MSWCCNYDAVHKTGGVTQQRNKACFAGEYDNLNFYKEINVYVLEEYKGSHASSSTMSLNREEMRQFITYLTAAGFTVKMEEEVPITVPGSMYDKPDEPNYKAYKIYVDVEENGVRATKLLLNVIRAIYEKNMAPGIKEFLRQGKKKNKQVTMLERLIMSGHINSDYSSGHHWLPTGVVVNLNNLKEQVFQKNYPEGSYVSLPTIGAVNRGTVQAALKDQTLKLHEIKAKFLGNA